MLDKKNVPSVESLSGQQKKVAQALLKHGYIDKEFALLSLKIRGLAEIIRRLRRKGWDIETHEDNPSRLYTLRRTLPQDVRLITSAINQAISVGRLDAARNGARNLLQRIEQDIGD